MTRTVVYASTNLLTAAETPDQLLAIQTTSLARNSVLNVTGLLAATPTFFAQFLEGTSDALESIMTSIRKDVRHRDVVEAWPEGTASDKFPRWCMTYFGPGAFTDRQLEPTLRRYCNAPDPEEARSLVRFLRSLLPSSPAYRADNGL